MAINRYNATLRNLEYRLRSFKDDAPRFMKSAVLAQSEAIRAAIINQLYQRGINGKGVRIDSYQPYTATTKKIKEKKGQVTTRVTLRDTGDFHYVIYVEVDDEGFYITSEDWKTDALVAKYGPEIFRLTDENFTRLVRGPIKRELAKQIRAAARKAKSGRA